jgi:glycosyltransferase involved in cell wall biosynthesis
LPDRRVLMIAQAYYPSGAIGAHRPGKFVRYLRGLGWQPVVLTLREDCYRFVHPMVDPALESQIPPDLEIIRTRHACMAMIRPLLADFASALGKRKPEQPSHNGRVDPPRRVDLKNWIEVPESIGWLPFSLPAGLANARRCDLIWATSPPTGGLCLGAILARVTRRPFIADLRDPWRVEEAAPYPTRLHASLDRRWERFVLRTASRVVVVTAEMADEYRRRFPTYADKLRIIYNGFDQKDYPSPDEKTETTRHTGELSIGYFGAIYQGRQQFLQRFLQGVHEILLGAGTPKLRFVFRGPDAALVAEQASSAGVEHVCDIGSPVPYRQALEMMSRLDVMLLIGSEVHGYALPGKLFEYVGARKPILAVTPDGAVARFVREQAVGIAVDPSRGGDLVGALRELDRHYEKWVANVDAAAGQFSRQAMTRELAVLLDETVAEHLNRRAGAC